MSETEEVTKTVLEEIQKFAQIILEKAKENLIQDGFLQRVCFLFCDEKNANIEGATRIEQIYPRSADPSTAEQVVGVVVLDLSPNDWGLLDMISQSSEGAKEAIATGVNISQAFGVSDKDTAKQLLDTFKNVFDVSPQDIIAKYIRHMVKKTQAYGLIHVSEGWALLDATERKSKSLAEDPNSVEVIMLNVQAKGFQSLTTVVFERTERDTGKVVGFKEPKVSTSRDGTELAGRLANLIN